MEESCPQEKTGMRCTVGKLGSSCCVVPAGVTVFRCVGGWSREEKWCTPAFLSLQKSCKDSSLSRTDSEISKEISLQYISDIFKLLPPCCSSIIGLFVVLCL